MRSQCWFVYVSQVIIFYRWLTFNYLNTIYAIKLILCFQIQGILTISLWLILISSSIECISNSLGFPWNNKSETLIVPILRQNPRYGKVCIESSLNWGKNWDALESLTCVFFLSFKKGTLDNNLFSFLEIRAPTGKQYIFLYLTWRRCLEIFLQENKSYSHYRNKRVNLKKMHFT